MKPVIIHSEATRELDNAIQYYEKQKIGLGLDLLSEIEQALEKIKINPNLGTAHTIEGVRRYVIRRFPYNNSTQSPLALAVGCSVAPFRGRELS